MPRNIFSRVRQKHLTCSIPQENSSTGTLESTSLGSGSEERSDPGPRKIHFDETEENSNFIEQETSYSEMEEDSDSPARYTCIEMVEISDSVIKKMLENSALHSGISERCSIHKVPELFHKMTEPSRYRPRAISIGPFHCRDQSLKANEGLKLQYAHDLLARAAKKRFPQEESATTTESSQLNSSGALVTIFEECFTSIKKIETKVRRCYSEPIDINSWEFVKMMVIDGLFIIELFIKIALGKSPFESNLLLGNMVTKDLLLLENQLPLFVLKCLFDVISLPEHGSLVALIAEFMSRYTMQLVPGETNNFHRRCPGYCYHAEHLLDVLGEMLQPPLLCSANFGNEEAKSYNKIPSAAELSRAGVRFKKGYENNNFMDIEFTSDGIFEIPPTYIYCGTDTMIRNLIATEQLYSWRNKMTSYAVLMDSLINSAEDVAVLRKAGIFKSFLGCDEDVFNVFNKLGSEVILKKNSYSDLEKEVNKYYKMRRHIWKATLKREYFNNPWSIISVCAAVLLILLTIISTVFGILQVVSPNK
ncbi:hypothetical protein MKX03_020355 [Papaver bracteatum]|nr:hypothetical protein MKX03_020355 [Papaver bracteatum]